MKIIGESDIASKFNYEAVCSNKSVPKGLQLFLSNFDAVQSLDYYDCSSHCCQSHKNTIIYVNENILFNAQYRSGPAGRNREIVHENARHFIAVSESVRECLIAEGIEDSRITVIPFWCAVQPEQIGYRKEFGQVEKGHPCTGREYVRGKYFAMHNLSPDAFIVLYVGRVVKDKGLEIFYRVLETSRDMIGVIVGEGTYFPTKSGGYDRGQMGDYYTKRSGQSMPNWENLFKLGPASPDGLCTLYHMADVLVLPSLDTPYWREQFGRVLTEAMSCGLPQIATDIGGPRDIVDHGKTGFLIPPNNVDSLRGVLKRLRDEPELRKAMKQESLSRWDRLYRKEVVDKQIMECYRKNVVL